jgi:hypothetical protein
MGESDRGKSQEAQRFHDIDMMHAAEIASVLEGIAGDVEVEVAVRTHVTSSFPCRLRRTSRAIGHRQSNALDANAPAPVGIKQHQGSANGQQRDCMEI